MKRKSDSVAEKYPIDLDENYMTRLQIEEVSDLLRSLNLDNKKFDKRCEKLKEIMNNCVPPDEDLIKYYDRFINLSKDIKKSILRLEVYNLKMRSELEELDNA